MTFIALVVALLLSWWMRHGVRVQHDEWFDRLCRWLDRLGLPPGVTLALAIGVPAIAAAMLLAQLAALLFGLLWMVAAVFLLLYAFGRGNPGMLVNDYRSHVMPGDFEGAWLMLVQQRRDEDANGEQVSPGVVHQDAQRWLMYEGYQHWFAPVFYFVLMGPVGALVYRLLQLRVAQATETLGSRLLHAADWVPSRLQALGFLLTGDFLAGRDRFLDALGDGKLPAGQLLYEVGAAALHHGDPLAQDALGAAQGPQCGDEALELRSLMHRAGIAWLVLVCLVIILA